MKILISVRIRKVTVSTFFASAKNDYNIKELMAERISVRSSNRFLRIKNTMMEIIDEKIMTVTPVSESGRSWLRNLFFRGLFFVHCAPGFSFLFVLSNRFFSTTQSSSVSFSRGLI